MGFSEELQKYEEMKADQIVLERKLEDKKRELDGLKQNFTNLCKKMEKEKADFDKLKKASLSQVLAKIGGNYDARCDKEYREYIEAKRLYDEAQYQVGEAQNEVSRLDAEIMDLKKKIPEKLRFLRESFEEGKAFGEQMDKKREELLCQRKEILEALQAVDRTKTLAKEAYNAFDSASFSAAWDMFGGGGLWADMSKYSSLENAQNIIYAMNTAVQAMKKELADVDMIFHEEINTIDDSTRFFDVFFDNIFTDWKVKNQIEDNKSKVKRYIEKLTEVEETLKAKNQELWKEMEGL